MNQQVKHKLLEQKYKNHYRFNRINDCRFIYFDEDNRHIHVIHNGVEIEIGDTYEVDGILYKRTGEWEYLLVGKVEKKN